MKKLFTYCVFMLMLFAATMVFASDSLKGIRVLVYTKNGKGFVHDNISEAVKCLQKLGAEQGFKVDVSDNPSVFTSESLKRYTLLIFASTNNDVFDTDVQRLAFRHYIEAGGGFVGIHSVTGTERNWTWFKQMIGCTFSLHALYQKFTVKVIASNHPSVKGVPVVWEREDECYFGKEWYPGITAVMVHDLSSLPQQADLVTKAAGSFSTLYPCVWYQRFDGGSIWITTLGHSKENYSDPVFVNHLLSGIKYVAGDVEGLHNRAYAENKDSAIKY